MRNLFNSMLLSLLLLASTYVYAATSLDRIVATVNDDIITQSELDERIASAKRQLKSVGIAAPPADVLDEQVLNRLIEEHLILQQAASMGMQIDDAMLNKTLISIAENNGTDLAGFRQMLEADGYTFVEFREQVRTDMLINQVQQQRVGYNIVISEEEVNRIINEIQAKDTPNTQYRVGHILIALPRNPSSTQVQAAQEKAGQAINALEQSNDFSQVALKYSDSSNVLEQADLGWRTPAQLPSLISGIVPTLKVHEVAGPLRNSGGLHVIQLLEKRNQAGPNIQREQAREYLYQQKLQEAMQAWITQLRDGAHIETKI